MDLYHCQIVEGDLAMKIRKYLPTGRVGHLQIAGVPERHEPDLGELNYPYLFELIDELGYGGWIGCEYRPRDRRPRPAWAGCASTLPESQIMKLLITGGAGFVGARLARTLLARGTLAGQPIDSLVLADQFAPPPDLLADPRVARAPGHCWRNARRWRDEAFDGVFHLASAVSGECEADFDLGLRSNLDSTRALLDAFAQRGNAAARVVFSSSVAVFGPDPAVPLPAVVADDTLPAPQTSLRHAEADLRAPDRRLHAQGLHRRPRRAPDDGDGAPRQAQRRGVVVLQRHHPRAAGGRRVGLPGRRRASRTRCRRRRARSRA